MIEANSFKPLLFIFALEFASQEWKKGEGDTNGVEHLLLVCVDAANLFGESRNAIKRSTQSTGFFKEGGVEVSPERNICLKTAGQNEKMLFKS
jgi:hypothetical protein